LTPVQQEQLSSLGLYLQSVRKEQNRTAEEVATQIFIRPALLKALELADIESLPEPVFIQGFIRRYGDALGLDGNELAQQFDLTLVSVLPNPDQAKSGEVDGVIAKADQHRLKVVTEAAGGSPINGKGVALALGGIAIAAVVAVGVWVLPPMITASLSNRPTASETPETPDPDEDTPVAAEAESSEPLETASAVDAAPITVDVNLTNDAWMRVTADGEVTYEGILANGTAETWTAETELTIMAGNAGAVLVSFNGASETPMGNPGSVQSQTFTSDGTPTSLETQ
jgi:cytoskeletal protein RodZ